MPKGTGTQKYILCNSDESEPGTAKDRDILRYNPHAVIEGMAIACYATGSHGRLQLPARRVPPRAVRAPRGSRWPRPTRTAGSARTCSARGIDIDIYNALGAGAYICGEETALMESLEGKKGQPRYKPPFPANFGLYGKPTTINNTETYASVPAIIRNGAEWFLNLGKPNNGGPKIFSVSGHVAKPGQLRDPPRHVVRRTAADGRRHAGRAQAQGRDPGRLVDAGAAGRDDDGADDGLRLDPEGRFRPRFGRGHRDGRDHLHGARLPAHRALLFQGKLRPVHAVPRRHRLDVPHADPHRRQARRRSTTCTCSRPPPARSKATPSARSAKPRRGRCRASCATTGTSSSTRS